jgi:drug/metabolite transporter (DMT)-like permease
MLVHGALCGVSHFLVIRALMLTSVSLSAPFGYAGLLWAIVLGVAIFDERPDWTTLAGGALIALAGILLAREAVRRPPPAPGAKPERGP